MTEYSGVAVAAMQAEGRYVDDEALAHISPARSENVNFFGSIETRRRRYDRGLQRGSGIASDAAAPYQSEGT